jgi:hypothetical protein
MNFISIVPDVHAAFSAANIAATMLVASTKGSLQICRGGRARPSHNQDAERGNDR